MCAHDDTGVGEPDPKDGERRRSPRFCCSGHAKIYCLPFDGKSIAGTLRNLSLGGICLDLAHPIEPGARTELIVRVNDASFRAAALVRGQRDALGASLQFMQLSAGGREVLAELLERLARVQVLNRKLRSSHIDEETERILAERPKFRIARAASCAIGASSTVQACEPEEATGSQIVVAEGFAIDLFG